VTTHGKAAYHSWCKCGKCEAWREVERLRDELHRCRKDYHAKVIALQREFGEAQAGIEARGHGGKSGHRIRGGETQGRTG